MADNLKNALLINVVLAVFNMLPIPPLDGGRVAVGLLPKVLAYPLSRLEPYGMLILIGVLILLPVLGSQFGLNLDVISAILRTSTGYVISSLLFSPATPKLQKKPHTGKNRLRAMLIKSCRYADRATRRHPGQGGFCDLENAGQAERLLLPARRGAELSGRLQGNCWRR